MTIKQQVKIRNYDELTALVNETLSEAMEIPVDELKPDYLLSLRDNNIGVHTSTDSDYLDLALRLGAALDITVPSDSYAQRIARTPSMIAYGIAHLMQKEGKAIEGIPEATLLFSRGSPLSLQIKIPQLHDERTFGFDAGSETIFQSTQGYNPQTETKGFEKFDLEDVSRTLGARGKDWLKERLFFQAASTYTAAGLDIKPMYK